MRSLVTVVLVCALAGAGCGAFARNMNPGHEFGEDMPPPPPEKGQPAAVFSPLASKESAFRQWRVMESAARNELGDPVIPNGARFLRAYAVSDLWDDYTDKFGRVVGRAGYIAVLYRDEKSCVWVRARFFQRHYGAGKFAQPEILPFEAGHHDGRLSAAAQDERKYRYACKD